MWTVGQHSGCRNPIVWSQIVVSVLGVVLEVEDSCSGQFQGPLRLGPLAPGGSGLVFSGDERQK